MTENTSSPRDVYIVDGARTPFLKAKGKPGPFSASDFAPASVCVQRRQDLHDGACHRGGLPVEAIPGGQSHRICGGKPPELGLEN